LHKYRRPALEESDVVVVQEEEEGDEGEDTQEGATGDTGLATLQTTGGKEIVFNFLMLMAAVAAHSSNSTALHMLVGVSPPIKLFWRMSASYLLLLPLAIRFLYQEGFPKLSLAGCLTFASAAFFYSAQNLLFYTALEYTTIGNAVIYANSQALLLIVGKAFVGERIHILEGIGVVVAFGGAVVCSQDSERESEASPETDDNALFGDFLALCSSALGVAYLTVAKAVRSEISVSFFITFVMFVGSIMVLTYLSINPHEELSFDMDPYHGVFGGFSTTHHRFAVMAYLAIVVNMVGSMGFIRAMEFFDTVVIAVATLIEPLTASFIAYAFNAGLLPGPLGWVGNCLVFVGTLMVVYPSMGRAEKGMH
jgi:drug/metabolite transporter (DMT)-like permease